MGIGNWIKMTRLNSIHPIKAVVFDMDGTLCLPQPWMFPAMREAIGLHDKSVDILAYIDDMSTEEAKLEANRQLEEVEDRAMKQMEPQPGLVELLRFLTLNNMSKNICTRNVIKPVQYLISNFVPKEYSNFEYIVTRDFRPAKPNPDPLLHIAKQLKVHPNEIMMVGDSFDDMRSGRSAGCVTMLLNNHVNKYLLQDHQDLIDNSVDSLADIIGIITSANEN
ncbi:hypothetical protein NCAS_0H02210 [Naumovozyma castellii]|uniref:HAD superfamily hydrolase n=1 Tax=Naumovozyma castellii TaxID=27288 RepID=G0VJ52_NAUCA|nr:hypothetical protein NCAS_0H02210 [Naumovozyma castellii CBS 4309]CCC71531.1 hypothetical protein NCAS_0H02210 [Naumovozyma castellii CBS 4309]